VWYFRIVPTVWYFRIVPTVWYFRIVPTVWYFRIVPTVWNNYKIPHSRNNSKIPHCRNNSKIPHCRNNSKIPHRRNNSKIPHCPNNSKIPHCQNNGILELFRQCGILELFRQCGILELFRQCGIFLYDHKAWQPVFLFCFVLFIALQSVFVFWCCSLQSIWWSIFTSNYLIKVIALYWIPYKKCLLTHLWKQIFLLFMFYSLIKLNFSSPQAYYNQPWTLTIIDSLLGQLALFQLSKRLKKLRINSFLASL
jgi:hypothetical protein